MAPVDYLAFAGGLLWLLIYMSMALTQDEPQHQLPNLEVDDYLRARQALQITILKPMREEFFHGILLIGVPLLLGIYISNAWIFNFWQAWVFAAGHQRHTALEKAGLFMEALFKGALHIYAFQVWGGIGLICAFGLCAIWHMAHNALILGNLMAEIEKRARE